MKANCWKGTMQVEVEEVPDPRILNPGDAILRITSTAICGSDLHLYNGLIPTMEKGDVLGHEFMGEVVEVGPAVRDVRVGDRVVNAFPIACGACLQCARGLFSLCENSNPNAGWRRSCGASPRPASTATRTCWGASPAGRRSTPGCPSPTWACSRCRTG